MTVIDGMVHNGQGFIHLAAEVGNTSSTPLLNESSRFNSTPVNHHNDFYKLIYDLQKLLVEIILDWGNS